MLDWILIAVGSIVLTALSMWKDAIMTSPVLLFSLPVIVAASLAAVARKANAYLEGRRAEDDDEVSGTLSPVMSTVESHRGTVHREYPAGPGALGNASGL